MTGNAKLTGLHRLVVGMIVAGTFASVVPLHAQTDDPVVRLESQAFAQHDLHVFFQVGQKGQPGRLILAQVFGQLLVGGGQELEDARRAVAGHAGERQARKLRSALTNEVIGAPVLF